MKTLTMAVITRNEVTRQSTNPVIASVARQSDLYKTFSRLFAIFGLSLSISLNAAHITSTVNASNLDAEQQGSSVDIDSSDLEFIYDGSTSQQVGIRFPSVAIAKNTYITYAYIQFSVDETSSGTTNVNIYGHDTDAPAVFTTAGNDISSRTLTSASVAWNNIPAWNTVAERGTNQQTPNLSSIVMEINSLAQWGSGDNMAFILKPGTGCSDLNCRRTAESYDGDPAGAATLHLYTEALITPFAQQVNENAGTVQLTIYIPDSNQPSSVSYTTINGTAVAGVDFTAQSGILTFAAHEKSKTITIPIINNSNIDGDRIFQVRISNPSGTVIESTADTASVTIKDDEGVNFHEGSRPFTIRNPINTRNIVGNYFVGGNTNICVTDHSSDFDGACTDIASFHNNSYYTKYIDIDNNSSTFNSSSFTLGIPAGSKVIWAGLYWQGYLHNSDQTNDFRETMTLSGQAVSGSGKGLDLNVNSLDAEKVLFKAPQNTDYHTVVAQQVDYDYLGYAGFRDVTSMIDPLNANGVYTVANIQSHEGKESNHGNFAGWSLVVVYENATEKLNNVSVFDGYATVDSSYGENITVSGFYTPTSGTIVSKLTVFSMEGESSTGDTLTLDNASLPITGLDTDSGTQNNVFNGSITRVPARDPIMTNNDGLDLDTFDTSSIIKTGQSSAVIKPRTSGDRYTPSMLVFSTNLYIPDICYQEKIYKNGLDISGNGVEVDLDDNLTVRVFLTNRNKELAQKVQIIHTFDSKFSYVPESSYANNANPANIDVNTSKIKLYDANSTVTEQDLLLYNSGTEEYKINLGSDANVSQGGDFLDSNKTRAWFEYNGTVASVDSNYTNVYKASYVNTTLGLDFSDNPVTIYSCDGSTNSFFGIGAVNIDAIGFDTRETSIALNDNNRSIMTKIANKPISLNVVPLNTSGAIAPYSGINNNRVYLFAVDSSVCSLQEADRLAVINTKPRSTFVTFMQTDENHIAPDFTETLAGKDKKILMNFINWNQEFLDAAFNCSNSNTQAVLNGVPQCLNSDSKLTKVFPNLVNTCLLAGAKPACQSSSYASSGVPSAPYDNEFGCYQCLAGGAGAAVCSTDNFSIRPERFEITTTNAHAPDLLRSGSDYNTTINAYGMGGSVNTLDYNTSNANLSDLNASVKLARDGNTTVALDGTATFTANGFYMEDGVSTNGVINEVAGIKFDNVGQVKLLVKDKSWASVDNDDTPQDCNGTWICGEKILTFIPHHFGFEDNSTSLTNSGNGAITYLSNLDDTNSSTWTMSASVGGKIVAQNEQNGTTTNFKTGDSFYENPVAIAQSVNGSTHGVPSVTTIDSALLGFASGIKTLQWNDTNTSQMLRFNFPRTNTATVNPFEINTADVNLSATSTYTATAGTANITGNKNGLENGKATFVYGRAHAPRQRATAAAHTASIYYESYCFGTDATGVTCNKALLPNGAASSRTDDVRWFVNTSHSAQRDGNVTALTQSGAAKVAAGVPTNGAGNITTVTLTYDQTNSYPYKTTMDMTTLSNWLVYHPTSATILTNPFQIEYDKNNANWSGAAAAGQKTKNVGGAKTNRRTMW